MKFNNIFNAALIAALSLASTSCDSFFETDPYDFVSPEVFYSNEKECNMALTGIYSRLASDKIYGNSYSCLVSNVDDLSYYYRKAAQTTSKVFGNDHDSSNGDLYDIWFRMYDAINNANALLENIDAAKMDEGPRTRIKGETKFLRAYFHFLLAQMYYDVPLRDHTISDINNHMMKATSHKEVIDWCISEMEACVDMVDDSTFDTTPGHIKKNTVMGILARVYLWRAGFPCEGGQSDYKKAAEWAGKVKASGKHKLNPDVYAIWKNMSSDNYDTEYNESIWEMEATGTRDNGIYTFSRIGNTIGNLQENASATGAGYSYAFFAGSLLLWDLYDEADARRNLSMAEYKIDKKDVKVMWKETAITDRRCGKYRREWETLSPKNKNWTMGNYPILRYADVLLMVAEAENEANQKPTPLAYECINEVRVRAGIEPVANMSYADFQQLVRDERGRELCFESLRRYDLVRWGIYLDQIKKLGEATADKRWSKNTNASGCAVFCERTQKKHLFFPVPAKELASNILLEQNEYWK